MKSKNCADMNVCETTFLDSLRSVMISLSRVINEKGEIRCGRLSDGSVDMDLTGIGFGMTEMGVKQRSPERTSKNI